jgi:hypothetical protein
MLFCSRRLKLRTPKGFKLVAPGWSAGFRGALLPGVTVPHIIFPSPREARAGRGTKGEGFLPSLNPQPANHQPLCPSPRLPAISQPRLIRVTPFRIFRVFRGLAFPLKSLAHAIPIRFNPTMRTGNLTNASQPDSLAAQKTCFHAFCLRAPSMNMLGQTNHRENPHLSRKMAISKKPIFVFATSTNRMNLSHLYCWAHSRYDELG